jgi:putative glutamine amidotransferase
MVFLHAFTRKTESRFLFLKNLLATSFDWNVLYRDDMTAPIIGVTTYRQTHEQGYKLFSLAEAYVQALVEAGGIPLLIPLGLYEDQINRLPSQLDGILFSGGGDISPDAFVSENHPEINYIDTDRDRVEFQLVLDAIHARLPIFGICRGLQVINVALGGTLYTHIPDQLEGALNHPHIIGNPRNHLAHKVEIIPNSLLGDILDQSILMVNSLHHQGVDSLAPGLTPTAYAPDGLIEGIELDDYPFGLAVQWHPEWLTRHKPMRALFRSFVEAAAL